MMAPEKLRLAVGHGPDRKEKENVHQSSAGGAKPNKPPSGAPGASVSSRLKLLQDQGDYFTRRIETERRRLQELNNRYKELDEQIREYRLAQRSRVGSQGMTEKEIASRNQMYENRLDKALVKMNEAKTVNVRIRESINDLRRERLVLDKIRLRMEGELQRKKRHMARVIEDSNRAYEQRDATLEAVTSLQRKAQREQESFEAEYRELAHSIESDRRVSNVLAKRTSPGSKEEEEQVAAQVAKTEEEEHDMKKKLARGQWRVGRNKANLILSQEKVESYEQAFQQIQEATGIASIEELVEKFIDTEDKNFRLFNFVNDVNKEIEQVETTIAGINAEIEKYKGQGDNSENQRKRILQDLEVRLGRTTSKAQAYESRYTDSSRVMSQLKVGIGNIFHRLGCSSTAVSDLLGSSEVSELNIMQYLGVIEQRTNEILQLYAAKQSGMVKDSNSLGNPGGNFGGLIAAGGTEGPGGAASASATGATTTERERFAAVLNRGPTQPSGTVFVDVEPPSLDEVDSDEEQLHEPSLMPMSVADMKKRVARRHIKQSAAGSNHSAASGTAHLSASGSRGVADLDRKTSVLGARSGLVARSGARAV